MRKLGLDQASQKRSTRKLKRVDMSQDVSLEDVLNPELEQTYMKHLENIILGKNNS